MEKKNKYDKEFYPLVSIVIPVYNGSDFLQEAIDSALEQTYKNIEILVINDGSNDEGATERIALSYGDHIRYFSKKNGGVASALNMGLEQMRGEYFSWLSHDDLYFPEKIERQIDYLRKSEDKTIILAGGYTLFRAEDRVQFATVEPLQQYTQEMLAVPLNPIFKAVINGCALLIHRSHFERIGMFDENLPTTQDYDLWFRMFRGQRVIFQEGTYMKSRCHVNQGSRQGNHTEECSRLWIKMMDEVTAEECEAMEGSTAKFYYSLYRFLLNGTQYTDAIIHAKEKAIEEIWKEKNNQGHVEDEWLELIGEKSANVGECRRLMNKFMTVVKEDGIWTAIGKLTKKVAKVVRSKTRMNKM